MTTTPLSREHRAARRFVHRGPHASPAPPSGGHCGWTTLTLLVIAQFMVVLDITIVNVALPSIGNALSFAPSELQWVVTAYTLCSGGLVLVGGRASDLFGRRRMFLAGLSLFTGASLASGLAPSAEVLIASRVAQGIGAAAMTPAALSILTTAYEGKQRATALSIWGAIASGAVAVGVIAGGALTSLLSWHWVFLVNVPVGLASLGFSAHLLPSGPPSARVPSMDPVGALTAIAGLVAIVYALSGAPRHGWGSLRTIALLAAGVLLLAAFGAVERSIAEPLIAPAIWRERALIAGAATILGISGILIGTFFLLSTYTQEVLHWSALHTGASLLPFVGAIAVGVHLTGRLISKLGSRPLIMSGMALAAVGSFLFALAPGHASYLPDLLPGLLVLGFGMGVGFPAASITAMSEVREDIAGLASGITATAHELGGAVGVGILAAIAAGGSTTAAGDHTAFVAAAVGGAALVAVASTIVPSVRPAPGRAVAIH